jgi:branched-subunit amino acid transport protein
METFFLVTGMMLVTFSIRYVLLPLSGRIHFSDNMKRAMGHVPPAVLTAIIAPAVLVPDGRTLELSWSNPYLVGAAAAILIGWVGRNLLITVLGGMAVFALWQWAVINIAYR